MRLKDAHCDVRSVKILPAQGRLLSAFSDAPGSFHELDEVVVVVNGGADSGVVLVPLTS